MNQQQTGSLIRALRKERNLSQLALAEQLHVTAQAVSKWERGLGCPDSALLVELAQALGTQTDTLLSGCLAPNERTAGNMKKLQFFICPHCGNILTAATAAAISCCGRNLTALTAQKAPSEERLLVEQASDEYFVSSTHEMTREHFISFVALVNGDTLVLRRLYPEWDMQTTLPAGFHGKLLWYCTQHGLFWQPV